MNLVSLPDGRIVNLDHLTHAERTGDYVILHLGGGSDGVSIIRVKQGEGARRVWAYIAGKCTAKIETPPQP
jgi:hydrogenase maturation factor